MMIVSGRLQIRNYTDKNGNKRTAAEVVCENEYFGGAKKAQSEEFEPLEGSDSDLPF
jgi:single-stranded DNA-binding protein